MGRRADEDLPEVVINQPSPRPHDHLAHAPEVVPDSSPEAAQQRYFMETDKYPAYYDNAPKFPYEEPTPTAKPTPGMPSPGMQSPGRQYQQLWDGGEHPVSALSPNSSLPWQSFPHDDQATYVGSEPEQEQRICGIRKRLFAIIAIVLGVVVIAVAVGAGVGGSMAAKQANEAAASATASASGSGSSATGTGSSAATASSTTSSAPKPTVTDLSTATDDSFSRPIQFQGWSEHNFKGQTTGVLTEVGFYDIGFNITSYVWINHKDGCCVTFCRDENTYADGYQCDSLKRPAVEDEWGLPRANLWCGNRNSVKSQQKCK